MKHFNMTQWRVLCPHNHLLKAITTTGDIRELSSYPAHVDAAYCYARSSVVCPSVARSVCLTRLTIMSLAKTLNWSRYRSGCGLDGSKEASY